MRTGQDGAGRAGPPAPGAGSAPRSRTSIAPVGLEVGAENAGYEELELPKEEAQGTWPFRIPPKRRRLGGVVAGAVAGCALILVAAIIARVSHASNAPSAAANVAKSTLPAAPAANAATMTDEARRAQISGPSPAATPTSTSNPTSSDAPTNAIVRLERPAIPGRVWIDGKKLTSKSALVGCGTHLIKVGARSRARSIEIPCGGEIVISK